MAQGAAGSEVLVDFIGGDIDRPIIVGQLHNGPHELPWPAGVDASTSMRTGAKAPPAASQTSCSGLPWRNAHVLRTFAHI